MLKPACVVGCRCVNCFECVYAELKRCPFCNSDASLVNEMNGKNIYYVRCQKCEAIGEKFTGNRRNAIDAWNTRAFKRFPPNE